MTRGEGRRDFPICTLIGFVLGVVVCLFSSLWNALVPG